VCGGGIRFYLNFLVFHMTDRANKISNPFCILPFAFVIFLTMHTGHASAQDSLHSGPAVVDSRKVYLDEVLHDSTKKMVELRSAIPGLIYDLRYAGKNNFMHRAMYPANTHYTFLRLPAVEALRKVQEELKAQGLGLKIFDAYRPYSVTVKFWELVHDERYVANPAKGSGHNRGIAVDLTIVRLDTGKELDMGTGFDNFTDTAHQDFAGLPAPVLDHRKLLRTVMEKYGFKPLLTEWWHFFLAGGERFEVLDIPFKQLDNLPAAR
jgi:zinc D-Ala-D-Ala dipeptidase